MNAEERVEPKVATVVVREKGTGNVALVHGSQIVSGISRSLPVRGTKDLLDAYSASPVLQAIVRKIATTVATVNWKAAVKDVNGNLLDVPNHIMANMLNGGVPGLDGFQCKAVEQHGIELAGESFAILARNAFGVPHLRWPIPSHWVRNVPPPLGDTFEIAAQNGSMPAQVQRRDLIWYKDPNPADPYRRGVGVARALSDELNADEAAAKHTGSSLMNRARPDIIISGSKESPLGKEAAERLHTIWTQRFGGPENQGKPFVSAGPITVSQLTPSFRELQLTKLREFERDLLITVFGIPPEIMGVIENANRATIESAEFLFMKHVIKPRLVARASTLKDQLAWQYDDRLEVTFDDIVQEDAEFKLKVMTSRSKAFSKDEVRDLAGAEPLPDGAGSLEGPEGGVAAAPDEANVQQTALNGAQIQALQSIISDVSSQTLSPAAAIQLISVSFPTIAPEVAEEMINAAATFKPAPPASPPSSPVVPSLESEQSPPGKTPGKAMVGRPLSGVTRTLPGGGFPRELPPGFAAKIQVDDIDEIVNSIDENLVARVMMRNHRAAVAEFSTEAVSSLGVEISFDITAPRVEEFLSDVAGVRSNLINGTTRKQLRAALSEGVAGGENTAKLSRRIRAVVTNATAARAETIARTEIVRASNFATNETFLQAGITEKEWLAVQDDRLRDSHAALDGQKVPATDTFTSPDGFEAMYPGDFGVASEDINCRCSVIAVDSAPEKAQRGEAFVKIEARRVKIEEAFQRQMVVAFEEQGEQALKKLRDKG